MAIHPYPARLEHVERLQLSLRREQGVMAKAGGYGVEVESMTLVWIPNANTVRDR
jgi:hypothetical protein